MDCKQLPETQCKLPHCVYVNTQKRKFCRKASNTRKTTLVKPVTPPVKPSPVKVTAKFLQMVCETSGECLSFGSHVHEIHTFFNGFTNFKYAKGAITKLGENSNNGFIREIKYERDKYNAYAVLKSTNHPSRDNIAYEYHVGSKFINQIIHRFPCFVHTYGLFYYKSHLEYYSIQHRAPVSDAKAFLTNALIPELKTDYKKACTHAQLACVLIQHLHNTQSVFVKMEEDESFIRMHMTHVLFIVYHALSAVSKVFTHYDLHQDNVLLFQPHKTKTIQYIYHQQDGSTVEFKCPYIPKIIDYGRCYVNNQHINSKDIYETLCKIPECGYCGDDFGFTFMDPEEYLSISIQKKNESHDLRLIHNLHKAVPLFHPKIPMTRMRSESYKRLEKMLSKVQYGKSLTMYGKPASRKYEDQGTKEDTTLHPKGDIVANVTDAYHELLKIVKNSKVKEENQRLQPDALVAGILHIYDDGRPMEYFKV